MFRLADWRDYYETTGLQQDYSRTTKRLRDSDTFGTEGAEKQFHEYESSFIRMKMHKNLLNMHMHHSSLPPFLLNSSCIHVTCPTINRTLTLHQGQAQQLANY